MMTFSDLNLNKQLLQALSDLEIDTPTVIQEKVFSVVMSGKDVCGIAQTGTGKTYAYLLPCLRQLTFSKDRNPRLMILVPTRELVIQVLTEIKKLIKYQSLHAVGVYGGVNIKPQINEVIEGLDILVGTPGRIVDLIASGNLRTKNIKKLVIDEFDEMLNLGFRTQLKIIFDSIPERRQNLLFSATLNEEVQELIDVYFPIIEKVEATPVGTPLENIIQHFYQVKNFITKINLLKHLLQENDTMRKVLVFVSTKHLADLVYEHLSQLGVDLIEIIHSNKSQNHRLEVVNNFQNGECRILIATDIIARGIDVAEVTHVINFDIPEVPETYIHRIGRTGRKDLKGFAISFVKPSELEFLDSIQSLMKFTIPELPFPETVEVSDKIIQEEEVKIPMKTIKLKKSNQYKPGPAFHEKSAKNSKVNVRKPRRNKRR